MKTQIITIVAVTLALSSGAVFAKSSAETPARMYQAEYIDLENTDPRLMKVWQKSPFATHSVGPPSR